MPVISRFLGIMIFINYRDHNPPHFHARYQDFEATIDINNLSVLSGKLPPRVLSLVVEWSSLHQQELIQNWDRARNREQLLGIQPLV